MMSASSINYSREENDDDNQNSNNDLCFYVQHGDYDVIKDLLRNKQFQFSANYADSDGCSLAQWAAINNRFNIMNLLIDNGADLLHTGGLLGENCLHWAMRSKYYNMVELLIRKNRKLLDQKNKNGANALLLSYELKDWYLMLLLLCLGSDPNCRFNSNILNSSTSIKLNEITTSTNENNTLLITILKNDCSHETLPFINLLLKFGASPSLTNNHGDNVFHVIAHNPKINLYLVYSLYKSVAENNNRNAVFAKNENNYSPWDVSRHQRNQKMTSILMDLLLFHALPFYTPLFTSCILVISFFGLLGYFGFFYGLILFFIVFVFLKQFLQPFIIMHRDRAEMGLTVGFGLSWCYVFIFETYYRGYISYGFFITGMIFFILSVLYAVLFHITIPDRDKSLFEPIHSNNTSNGINNDVSSTSMLSSHSIHNSNRSNSKLIKLIMSMAPQEGTFEEFEYSLSESNNSSNSLLHNASNTGLTTDIGCMSCLSDIKKSNHFTSHCATCDACVVDKELHITFLGNCSGKGNRRYMFLFVVSSWICLLIYLYSSSVTFGYICPKANGIMWNSLAVTSCLFSHRVDLLFLYICAFIIILAFTMNLLQTMSLIGAQSTLEHFKFVGGNSVIFNPKTGINVSICIIRVIRFMFTGQYIVTAYFDEDHYKDGISADSEVNLDEKQEEFLQLSRGGGPEVNMMDEDERREVYMKNKKCCSRHDRSCHHNSNSGGDNQTQDIAGGSKLPTSMQMNFDDRA